MKHFRRRCSKRTLVIRVRFSQARSKEIYRSKRIRNEYLRASSASIEIDERGQNKVIAPVLRSRCLLINIGGIQSFIGKKKTWKEQIRIMDNTSEGIVSLSFSFMLTHTYKKTRYQLLGQLTRSKLNNAPLEQDGRETN